VVVSTVVVVTATKANTKNLLEGLGNESLFLFFRGLFPAIFFEPQRGLSLTDACAGYAV
jgi:hypothetical protein